jgi:hypothetical protein
MRSRSGTRGTPSSRRQSCSRLRSRHAGPHRSPREKRGRQQFEVSHSLPPGDPPVAAGVAVAAIRSIKTDAPCLAKGDDPPGCSMSLSIPTVKLLNGCIHADSSNRRRLASMTRSFRISDPVVKRASVRVPSRRSVNSSALTTECRYHGGGSPRLRHHSTKI